MRRKLACPQQRRWRILSPAVVASRPIPDRHRAQLAVAVALRDGRLEKLPCEVCGAAESVEAHHDDLSAPLDVRWLCPIHTPGRP